MLEDLTPPQKKTSCRTRTILEELSEQDQKILLNALSKEEDWSHKSLSKELSKRGVVISDVSISRHRQGHCSC